MTIILEDQGGNRIPRFGAAGVKKVLMSPTKVTSDNHFNDYAMVHCEQSECYLTRHGKGARAYSLTLTYWNEAHEDAPCVEEDFAATDRDKVIAKFLKLCKRKPLYAPA